MTHDQRPIAQRFDNIEHARAGKIYGYSRDDRMFQITWAKRGDQGPDKFRARALTPREGMVNKLTGPSLLSISNQLSATL